LRTVLVIAMLLLSVAAGVQPIAAEQVVGQPDVSLSVQDNRIAPGERTSINVAVTNDGFLDRGGPAALEQRIKTARGVSVKIRDDQIDASIDVTSGTVALGSLPDGAVATAPFRLKVNESLEPGTYEIPVEVRYSYTTIADYEESRTPPGYTDVSYADSFRRETMTIDLVVEPEPRFEVVPSDTEPVVAGDTGTLRFTLQNVGSETAHHATVSLSARSNDIFFGQPTQPQPSQSVFIEELDPGEQQSVSVQVGARTSLSPGSYPVAVDVAYETPDGLAGQSQTLSTGVQVEPERTFAIRNLSTQSFRVDEDEANVRATVVNTGERAAQNVVVRVQGPQSVQATGPETVVGDLAPGESAAVRFTFAIPADAEPGSISLSFDVEYENLDGDLRQLDEPLRKGVALEQERDTFEVVDVDTELTAGSEATLAVTLRYTGSESIGTANAKVFVNDPLSSADDGAFIGEFEPGEERTAEFTISAAGTAIQKEYPATVEIRYDDANGESTLADGLQVGVPVSSDSGGLPVGYVGAGVGVLLLSGGVFLWQRQRG
jgi:hypothetical protein